MLGPKRKAVTSTGELFGTAVATMGMLSTVSLASSEWISSGQLMITQGALSK